MKARLAQLPTVASIQPFDVQVLDPHIRDKAVGSRTWRESLLIIDVQGSVDRQAVSVDRHDSEKLTHGILCPVLIPFRFGVHDLRVILLLDLDAISSLKKRTIGDDD